MREVSELVRRTREIFLDFQRAFGDQDEAIVEPQPPDDDMGNCCGSSGSSGPGPKVAVIGATGYVGKFVTAALLQGVKDKKISEVRVLSRTSCDVMKGYGEQGAKTLFVDFHNPASLIPAFSGVDVVISTMGTKTGDIKGARAAILTALEGANVKVYFPSEFGTNHYNRVKKYDHPEFAGKKEHFKAAKDKGIKTVAICCSLITETSFAAWLGLDVMNNAWKLVGTGDVPVAFSSEQDIARFTLEAVRIAYKDPINFPELIEIYSDLKTMKEYAKIFDKVDGKVTKLEFAPLKQAKAQYDKTKDFVTLLQILMAEGAFDLSDLKKNGKGGNEFLNPGENLWKLKTVQEYAEGTVDK